MDGACSAKMYEKLVETSAIQYLCETIHVLNVYNSCYEIKGNKSGRSAQCSSG